ncbi:MAG: hypothetical protein U0Q03_08460 [Acidimicrobiales bacterium]
MNSEAKIQELEAKVAELTALVERLVPQAQALAAAQPIEAMATETVHVPSVATIAEPAPRASRRGLLKLAGAAAAGTAAAVAANALPAAAADGDPITASNQASTTAGSTATTGLVYSNTAVPTATFGFFTSNTNLFTVRDTAGGVLLFSQNASSYPAAVGGYSYRTVANGVYGYSDMPGYGVVGYASNAAGTGVLARGTKANVELYPNGTAPIARADAHNRGEIVCDTDGGVWVCVTAGSPGTWRQLAGTGTAGSLHLLAAPKRVYSSRAADEPVAVGPKTQLSAGTRTVDCKNGSSGVPAAATGLVLNVTAIAASANGYLSVSPGGAGFSGTSTLNWSANGAVVANGVTVGAGAGATIDVTVGGGGTADFIVDVMGYYL